MIAPLHCEEICEKKEVIKPSHQFCAAKGWEPEKKVLSLADFINMQILGFPNVGENEKLKVTEKSSEKDWGRTREREDTYGLYWICTL